MTVREILKQSLLFSGLDDDDLDAIAAVAQPRPFRKGETLFSEGDEATGFFLLASGGVKLCKISHEGREKVLHFSHPGETFAEAALFGDGRYPASAVAIEGGEVLFFSRDQFLSLIDRNPRFALNLIVTLSVLLRKFARQIEELSFAEVPTRLASYLIDLAGRKSTTFQGRTYLDLDVKKGELAARLGTVGETLSRTFRKMKEDGIIDLDGSRVVIEDMERLKRLANR